MIDMPIFRWDIDKTYLETDFESLSGLWRAATEPAEQKISADGVIPLVQGLQRSKNGQLVFLSGSPKQMRSVLLKKFALDGIDVDTIMLKDTLKAIGSGRLSEIKAQFGHKVSNLLKHRVQVQSQPQAQTEYLFGDDVEQDALIYLTYRLIVEGQISWKALKRIGKGTNTSSEYLNLIRSYFSQVDPSSTVVQGIFIRLTKHQQPEWMTQLVPHLYPVHTWSQAALILFAQGVLSFDAVYQVCMDEGLSREQLPNLIQDIQWRGLIDTDDATYLYRQINTHRDLIDQSLEKSPLTSHMVEQAYRSVG